MNTFMPDTMGVKGRFQERLSFSRYKNNPLHDGVSKQLVQIVCASHGCSESTSEWLLIYPGYEIPQENDGARNHLDNRRRCGRLNSVLRLSHTFRPCS